MNNSGVELSEDRINEMALERLIEEINKRTVFAFIGAGCSAKLSYPGWHDLLCKLEEAIPNKEDIDIYRNSEECKNDKLWYAEKLVITLGEISFRDVIKDIFKPQQTMDSKFHRDLVSIPFRHYITTNYDSILDHAAEKTGVQLAHFCWNEKETLKKFFQNIHDVESVSGRYVIHIHGRYDGPDSIILTEKDYMKMYFEQETIYKILWSIISSFRMCFIGFELGDLDLLSIFRKSRWDFDRGDPRHYAIIDEDNVIKKRQTRRLYLREKYGIEPIFFAKQKKKGSEWAEQEATIEKIALLFSAKKGKKESVIKKNKTASLKKDARKLREINESAK